MKNETNKEKRPTKYTDKLADKICSQISTSTKGLKVICQENKDLPDHQTIYDWLKHPDNKAFLVKYQLARDIQADLLADEIIAIADDASNDESPGLIEGTTVTNHANIQRDRLRIDARKWKASKLAPKKYGEKVDVTTNGDSLKGDDNVFRVEIIRPIED